MRTVRRTSGPTTTSARRRFCTRCPDGRRVLMAGNKSGQVFAHDPDRDGARLWKAALVEKIGESEILFGGAADERTAYFGLDNGSLGGDRPSHRAAEVVPAAAASRPAARHHGRPDGDSRRGVRRQPGRDGARATRPRTGSIVWTFNMLQDFMTVNRVPARGGSMGAPGPTVAGGMLFVGSGYVGLGNGTPGNVLLVFGLP